jgi:O-antigen ligase
LIFQAGLRKRKIPFLRTGPNPWGGNGRFALGSSWAARSAVSADRPAAHVLIRRQIRGHIINIWLVSIVALGGVIAFADGLTRTPITEREASWNGPLEYEPYWGAFLLAGVAFPLMIAYARKARVPLIEGLFLWFVFCTAAYTRDFSYVRWPGAPLFVTDVVLVVLLFSTYILPRQHHPRCPLAVKVLLALFLTAGVLSAGRGFLGNRDPILVLRDSALTAYALFLLVGYHLFRTWLSAKRMAIWFLLGTALGALNGLGWFIAAPGERRFIYFGIYILISLVGMLVAITNRLIRPWIAWVFFGLLCVGLTLANARSLFVALLALLLLGLLGGRSIFKRIRIARLVPAFLTGIILVTLAAFLFLRTEAGRDFTERSAQELVSGVLDPSEDANWQFRLSAWKEAWRRFVEYPLGGEGFGIPFVFELLPFDNDPRPHNTYFTVLYKMGLVGFLPLLCLLVYFFGIALGALHRNFKSRRVAFLWIVVLAQVIFCLYGTANLLLESPFLSSLFWALMGLGLSMVRMLDLERSLMRSSYGH